MVLSNRKLKQKLREKLAQSLVESVAQSNPKSNGSENPNPNGQPSSLKVLLDSASQKPKLSKREKRRKLLALRGPEAVDGSGDGGNSEGKEEEDKREVGSEALGDEKKEKKKKKRKRDEEEKIGALSSEENGVVKETKKPKKKNKKKEKRKNEAKAEEEKKDAELGKDDQTVKVTNENTDRQAKGDVPTKVYVGGIPYYSTEDDIRSYFESCGTITEVDCLRFPDSGKFRGIAIISFKTEAAAKRALALDGAQMGELFLKIQPYKATRVNKVSDFAPQIIEGYNRIYVGNLSWVITEDDLRKLFSDCKISSINFGMDKETGEFRGYAHVNFSDSLSLTMALKLDQEIVCGRPVKISCAVPLKKAGTHSMSAPTISSTHSASIPTITSTDSIPVATTAGAEDYGGGLSAISGKIKRRTCYECGEKGHLSSACPKSAAITLSTNTIPLATNTSTNLIPVATTTSTYSIPVAKTISTYSTPLATTTGMGADNGGLSAGKIKRRTCYECGEKGHLSSACPKSATKTSSTPSISVAAVTSADFQPVAATVITDFIPVATATGGTGADNGGLSSTASGKIKRRTCYECGEKGHISSACPKKQSADQ